MLSSAVDLRELEHSSKGIMVIMLVLNVKHWRERSGHTFEGRELSLVKLFLFLVFLL